MNIIAWCTCALVGLLLCGNVQAAERKGIAAVGLSRLSGASAGNLAAAVKDSGCRQFEFTFMPFFNPGNPFNNVDTLLAIPNVGKIETICLSWRDEEAMNDDWEIALATLGKRAGEVNRHLNGIRHKVEKIVLVPMLEDQWTQARWLEAVHIIAGQLDSGDRIFFPPLRQLRERHAADDDRRASEKRHEPHLYLDPAGGASARPWRQRPGDQQ